MAPNMKELVDSRRTEKNESSALASKLNYMEKGNGWILV